MDAESIKKVLNELYPHLETLETQITALMEFLTAKGIVTDRELDPFLEEAGKRSSVKWLATRLRIEHALATSTEQKEEPAEISTKPPAQEPEEERPQETDGQQPPEKAEKKFSPDEEGRQPEQTPKRSESDKQPEKDAA